MYSHIMGSRRPAVVPPEPAVPPLRPGATPRPRCKARSRRPADFVFPAGAAGPWGSTWATRHLAPAGGLVYCMPKRNEDPFPGGRQPVRTVAAADGAVADLGTAPSPAGNRAIILEALQIQ